MVQVLLGPWVALSLISSLPSWLHNGLHRTRKHVVRQSLHVDGERGHGWTISALRLYGGCVSEPERPVPVDFEYDEVPRNVLIPPSSSEVIERISQMRTQGKDVTKNDVDAVFQQLLEKHNYMNDTEEDEKRDILPTNEEMRKMVYGKGIEDGGIDSDIDESSGGIRKGNSLSSDGEDAWDMMEGKKPAKGTTIQDRLPESSDGEFKPFVRSQGYIGDNIPGVQQYKEDLARPRVFKQGTRVILKGLTNLTQLNGQEGTVIGNLTDGDRYPVFLRYNRSGPVLIRSRSLELLKVYRYEERKRALDLQASLAINASDFSGPYENLEWTKRKSSIDPEFDRLRKFCENTTLRQQRMDVASYNRWESVLDPDQIYEKAVLAASLSGAGERGSQQHHSQHQRGTDSNQTDPTFKATRERLLEQVCKGSNIEIGRRVKMKKRISKKREENLTDDE